MFVHFENESDKFISPLLLETPSLHSIHPTSTLLRRFKLGCVAESHHGLLCNVGIHLYIHVYCVYVDNALV